MVIRYSPWGEIEWVMSRLPRIEKWGFLGCISTEERSLSAWNWLQNNKKVDYYEMWKIEDPKTKYSPYKDLGEEKYEERKKIYTDMGGEAPSVFTLLNSDNHLSEHFHPFLEKTDGNVIIDISTMPKRWFFPMIKECLEEDSVKSLLITYTKANHYSKIQGEDPMAWMHLPSFGEIGRKREKMLIISAGYQPLSLPEWIGNSENQQIYVLFPFPASIAGYSRTWDFIRAIESDSGQLNENNIKYVPGFNLPSIYDAICNIIENEKKEPTFMPYGPKPVSLAFAILATQLHFPVGYTQPMYYNPLYSSGADKTMSYLLKESGKELYKLPQNLKKIFD